MKCFKICMLCMHRSHANLCIIPVFNMYAAKVSTDLCRFYDMWIFTFMSFCTFMHIF